MEKCILDVPYISQSGRWPTGCESVSAVMLLRYLGISVSVDEFIENYLDKQAMAIKNNELYGPNPNKAFAGSPYDEKSFGCFAPVIVKSLKKCLGNAWTVVDETGTPTEILIQKYVAKGLPVIYWTCLDMKEPVLGPSWKLFDSKKLFTWTSNEHCVLLAGEDKDCYYFYDPWENHGLVKWEKSVVKSRHAAQKNMAVACFKIT